MELTITQNGALYALHHGANKKYRWARRKRAVALKTSPTYELPPESLADRKIQKEEVCFI